MRTGALGTEKGGGKMRGYILKREGNQGRGKVAGGDGCPVAPKK